MINIFFIPYAGSTSMGLQYWGNYFPEDYRFIPVKFAGRGERSKEALYKDFADGLNDVTRFITKEIDKYKEDDYVVFGHSMGGLLAYEVYYQLLKNHQKPPLSIFISARKAPMIGTMIKRECDCNDDEFLEIVSLFGGLNESFNNEEVRKAFVPILRADFKLLETYHYTEKKEKIKCDVTLLYGNKDATLDFIKLPRWNECTERKCEIIEFNGGHFFIQDEMAKISKIIVSRTQFQLLI